MPERIQSLEARLQSIARLAIDEGERHPTGIPVTLISDNTVAVARLENAREDLLLTSDAVIEGTDFLPVARPKQIRHKARGRVFNDLAATGG